MSGGFDFMGKERLNLVGLVVGKLTVIEFDSVINNSTHWKAKCECGTIIVAKGMNLKKGLSTSCGCNRKGHRRPNMDHPLYKVWISMRNRCNNPNCESYHRYGGRGIKVCERWDDYQNYYNDCVGIYVPGLEMDRINNDGNYEPGNIKASTKLEQAQNSSNAKLTGQQVLEIRASNEGPKALSEKYNVGPDIIWGVKARRSWKNW
jgi:hypothetical protein